MSNNDMTPEQFCYWLNGHFDLSETETLSEAQVKVIKEHLALVFNKKAPSIIDLMEDVKNPSYPVNKPFPTFFPPINNKPIC